MPSTKPANLSGPGRHLIRIEIVRIFFESARPAAAGEAIRIKASKNRHYMCPTGDNGNNIFCTRALFRIAANPRRCLTCDNGNRRYISCLLGQSGVGLE